MPYRRRRNAYRRRRRNTRRRSSRRRRLPEHFPQIKKVRIYWSQHETVTGLPGVNEANSYRINGLWDPDVDGIGTTPERVFLWGKIYGKYRVDRAHVKITVYPSEVVGSNYTLHLSAFRGADRTTHIGLSDLKLRVLPRSVSKTLISAGGGKATVLKKTFPIHPYIPEADPKEREGTLPKDRSSSGTDPTDQVMAAITVVPIGLADPTGLDMLVEIWYDVQVSDWRQIVADT